MAKSLLLVITGASRGLGREIAKAFFCDLAPSFERTSIALIARSKVGLEETERIILEQPIHSINIDTVLLVADLADLDSLDASLDEIFASIRDIGADYDRMIFINNAGTVGHVGPSIESPSLKDMQKHIDLNITARLWASVRFARFACRHTSAQTTIVNISSLTALQAFPTLALYSAGMAARDSYHAAMAKELEDFADTVRILNYAPGPLETDMTNEIRQSEQLDTDLRPQYDKKLLDPFDSARVLVKLVTENNFESGAHVDYYDVADNNNKKPTTLE